MKRNAKRNTTRKKITSHSSDGFDSRWNCCGDDNDTSTLEHRPTQVTEDVTVLAVTEHGCVGESVLGVSVVVEQCAAKVGDVISATFYIPAMEQNGYYDRIEAKLAVVEP